MTIGAILSTKGNEVTTVTPDTSVRDAVAVLAERRIGALPVVEGGAVKGVFSERDVIYSLRSEGPSVLDRTVGEVMTAPAVVVSPGERVLSALSLMTRRRIRHLPVVEGDRMVGLVSIGDLVKHRMENIEREAEALRSYIQSA